MSLEIWILLGLILLALFVLSSITKTFLNGLDHEDEQKGNN